MKYIRVLEAGLHTTIQDGGRLGYQNIGVPISGAMDIWNMYLSNLLVGKNKNSSVLEVTFIGPKLEFLNDMTIAITGAEMNARVNGYKVNNYESIYIKKGDILSFNGLKSGLRAYISFSGNIISDKYFESTSTYIKYEFGKKIKLGDLIELDDIDNHTNYKCDPIYEYDNVIRFIKTYEYTEKLIERFVNTKYLVSNDSDRMGMKLEGSALSDYKADIISSPIVPGTIQLPKNGKPIIMLKDAQTIGGYLRLACVIPSDLAKLAQLKPNDEIVFKEVTLEESRVIREKLDNKIRRLEKELISNSGNKTYRININNKLYNVKVEEL